MVRKCIVYSIIVSFLITVFGAGHVLFSRWILQDKLYGMIINWSLFLILILVIPLLMRRIQIDLREKVSYLNQIGYTFICLFIYTTVFLVVGTLFLPEGKALSAASFVENFLVMIGLFGPIILVSGLFFRNQNCKKRREQVQPLFPGSRFENQM
jgi:hypothetical protein